MTKRMARVDRQARRSRLLLSIQGPVAIAYCFGTLDRAGVEDLGQRLHELALDGVRAVVCSLERVSHIHFQALDPMLELQRELLGQGGRLVLCGASPYLQQILDFGGIPGQIALLPNRVEALQGLLASLPAATDASAAGVQQSLL